MSLTANHFYNLIVSDVAKEANNGGGICLMLSDRKEHCRTLQALLRERGIEAELLTGYLSNGARQEVVERLNSGNVRVLCATGQLIGIQSSSMAGSFSTSAECLDQRLGRDKARVYDYIDSQVGVLNASEKARLRVYGN